MSRRSVPTMDLPDPPGLQAAQNRRGTQDIEMKAPTRPSDPIQSLPPHKTKPHRQAPASPRAKPVGDAAVLAAVVEANPLAVGRSSGSIKFEEAPSTLNSTRTAPTEPAVVPAKDKEQTFVFPGQKEALITTMLCGIGAMAAGLYGMVIMTSSSRSKIGPENGGDEDFYTCGDGPCLGGYSGQDWGGMYIGCIGVPLAVIPILVFLAVLSKVIESKMHNALAFGIIGLLLYFAGFQALVSYLPDTRLTPV